MSLMQNETGDGKALFSELLTELSSQFLSRNKSERVRKARTLPKYFRILENGNFRNSQKQKVREKAQKTRSYSKLDSKFQVRTSFLSFL